MLKIKVVYEGDMRLFRAPEEDKLKALRHFILMRFALAEQCYTLQYLDDEGDKVTMSSENEFVEAMADAVEQGKKSLKVLIMSRASWKGNFPNRTPTGFSKTEEENSNSNSNSNSSTSANTAGKDACSAMCGMLRNPRIARMLPELVTTVIGRLKNTDASQSETLDIVAVIKAVLEEDSRFKGIREHSAYPLVAERVFPIIRARSKFYVPFLLKENQDVIRAWITAVSAALRNFDIVDMVINQGGNPAVSGEGGCLLSLNGLSPSLFTLPHIQPVRKEGPAKMMDVVKCNTLPDGTYYPLDTVLRKVWTVKNTGDVAWGPHAQVAFAHGYHGLLLEPRFPLSNLQPGAVAQVTAVIKTPLKPGRYQVYLQPHSGDGIRFGPKLWVDIFAVDESGFQTARAAVGGIPQDVRDHRKRMAAARALEKQLVSKDQRKEAMKCKKEVKLANKRIKLEAKSRLLANKLIHVDSTCAKALEQSAGDGPGAAKQSLKARKKNAQMVRKLEKKNVKLQRKMAKVQSRVMKVEAQQAKISTAKSLPVVAAPVSDGNSNSNSAGVSDDQDFVFAKELASLKEMGFADSDLIRALLTMFGGSVDAVIQEMRYQSQQHK